RRPGAGCAGACPTWRLGPAACRPATVGESWLAGHASQRVLAVTDVADGSQNPGPRLVDIARGEGVVCLAEGSSSGIERLVHRFQRLLADAHGLEDPRRPSVLKQISLMRPYVGTPLAAPSQVPMIANTLVYRCLSWRACSMNASPRRVSAKSTVPTRASPRR